MRTRTHIVRFVALALVSSFALGACGIRGELKTPPPMWGDDAPQQADKPQTNKQVDKPESNG